MRTSLYLDLGDISLFVFSLLCWVIIINNRLINYQNYITFKMMHFIYTRFGHLKSTFPISSDWLNPTLYFSEFINSRITWTSVLRKHRKKTPERKGCKDKTGKKNHTNCQHLEKLFSIFDKKVNGEYSPSAF